MRLNAIVRPSESGLLSIENASEFILKEYEALRREMDEAVKETRILERYALLAAGPYGVGSLALATLATNGRSGCPLLLFCFLGLVRFY